MEIEYTWTEGTLPAGYELVGNEKEGLITTITNEFTLGDLEISKTVKVENGDEEAAKAKEFTFTVKLYEDDTKAKELAGKYDYTVTENGKETATGKIKSGGTIKLKDGQTAKIELLPDGTYYEVTEAEVAGFEAEMTGDTGTVAKRRSVKATFTNTYSLEPIIVDPPGRKVLEVAPKGAEAPDITGKFTFTITAGTATDEDGNDLGIDIPMPEHTSITNSSPYEHKYKEGYFEFGEIEYTVPGIYTYTVTESGKVEGVVNDAESSKTITITVIDNGDGTLSFTDDYGGEIVYVNKYTAEEKKVVTGDSKPVVPYVVGFGASGLVLIAAAAVLIRRKKKQM